MRYHFISVCIATLGAGCISSDSKLLDATDGCDEYQEGKIESLELDADAEQFITASADVDQTITAISEDVYKACAAIAKDLGESDTWSDQSELEDKISNGDEQGACDAAVRAISDRVEEASEDGVTIRLATDKGECHIDYEAQKACDAECAAHPDCEPGPITERCEPAKITAFCEGSCEVDAYCMGSVEVAAECEGTCEGSCEGACEGTCYREDGTVEKDATKCRGVCDGVLRGQCYGHCKVEAKGGVECGQNVRCQGGCTGKIEEPACTTEYGPPVCSVNEACYEACQTQIAQEAVCEPSTVKIVIKADDEVKAEVKELVDTLEQHLPALVDASENNGLLLKSASERMADAGGSLSGKVENLDGKSLACVTAASSALGDHADTLNLAIKASGEVHACVKVE